MRPSVVRTMFVLCALSACWRDSAPPPQAPEPPPADPPPARRPAPRPLTDTEQAMQMMEKFADDLCACQDPACAQTVSDEMTRWSQEQARNRIEAPKLSDEDMKHMVEVGERMGRCMQNAMAGGSTSPGGSGAPPLGAP